MTTTIPPEPLQAPPDGAQASAENDLAEALRQDLTNYSGGSIGYGIMLAGGAYPIVLAAISLLWLVAIVLWQLVGGFPPIASLFSVAQVALVWVVAGAFGALLGVICAAIASAITMPVIYLFLRSLKLRGSIVRLGAASGGLAGFVALLPLTLSIPWTIGFSPVMALVIVLALGPALATFLGQIGGAWGGRRAAHYAQRVRVATAAIAAVLDQSAENLPLHAAARPTSGAKQPRLQFRIVHLLWIFVWLSLVLSVIKLSGIPFEFVLPLLVGWIVFQAATLPIAVWLSRGLGQWQGSRSAQAGTPAAGLAGCRVATLAAECAASGDSRTTGHGGLIGASRRST